jgi:hypothetical protein
MKPRLLQIAVVLTLLLAAAVAAWFIARQPRTGDNALPNGAAARATTGSNAPVQAFVEFVEDQSSVPHPDGDARYIADALERLAGALSSLGLASSDLNTDLRVAAAHVLLDPESVENAALVRTHLRTAVDVVIAMHPAHRARLQTRADALSAARPVVQQGAALRELFRACADALAGSAS